jgi:hypothetical protein
VLGATSDSGAGALVAVVLVVYLAIAVLGIVATVKIVTKAGYSGWYVLLWLVPIVGFVFFLVFAFSDWPVLQRLRAAEQSAWVEGPSRGLYRMPAPEPAAHSAPLPSFYGGAPPPGWYPEGSGERWWDGTKWTDHTR